MNQGAANLFVIVKNVKSRDHKSHRMEVIDGLQKVGLQWIAGMDAQRSTSECLRSISGPDGRDRLIFLRQINAKA